MQATPGAMPASDPGPAGASRPPGRPAAIRFTASGSEYFRIWIVNLLLSLVTLSLYYPFARARRLRYFHANTLVDGQPLGFHGDPWRMLRGHVVVVLGLIAYGLAGRLSPLAGAIAAAVFAALWPALWRASLRFRLGNTSWRGLRLSFEGDLAGAYRAYLPVTPVVAIAVLGGVASQFPDPALATGLAVAIGVLLLGMLAFAPLGLAWMKRYQHNHYGIATERTRFTARNASFYGLLMKVFGLSLLVFFVATVTAVGVAFIVAGALSGGGKAAATVAPAIAVLLFYLLMFFTLQPFAVARLQDLVWNHTASAHVAFVSRLGARRLAWRMVKNFFGTLFTLGLYRPFAVVQTTRLRLESVELRIQDEVNDWLDPADPQRTADAGDAIGDVLGVDIAL